MPCEPPKPASSYWIWFGVGLLAMSGILYFQAAHVADDPAEIRGEYQRTVISKGYGYTLSALSFCAGTVFIVRWVRASRAGKSGRHASA